MLRVVTGMTALLLLTAVPGWSDPGQYPEYAKVETSDKIPVQYIRVEELAEHIVRRKALILVDVRQPRSYAMQHITGARSIPLGMFYRGGEDPVPKEGLVVLY